MPLAVAIAGRPNVGKSTLFNRLIGKAMALIDDTPGVTRDWRDGDGTLLGLKLRLFDTAGLEDRRPSGSLAARMADRTREALKRADVVMMMVDGQAGLTVDDRAIARELRKTGKPVLVLVNKCEGTRLPPGYDEAAALGFDTCLAISALHGEGLGELRDALAAFVPNDADTMDESEDGATDEDSDDAARPATLHIAIAGRPNAGKSTLANQLFGEERLLTGPEPGLTRDSVHLALTWQGHAVRLVDTAGLRRRARIEERLEKMGAKESLRAIRLAHVVLLVIDAERPFDKQDYTIAQHVAEEGRALVVVVNKWDSVRHKPETLAMIRKKIEASLAQLSGVPLVTVSALKGTGMDALMKAAFGAYATWNARVSTGRLNRWLEGMEASHPPPIVAGRRVKLRYMTQVKSRPPTFALWVNKPVDLPDSYVRFLTSGLRKTFDLSGVPIRWLLRKGSNPYEDKREKTSSPPRRTSRNKK